ncbi:MAG: hypothetical protein LAO56_08035 [Acidobacteriia bacterium]|nr:hypothetical protein [Terriglobia bacterium]
MSEDRWTNWRYLIDTLNEVLAQEYPGLEQSDPVEFTEGLLAIRLTIQLRHDREKRDSPPEIFIFVTAEELRAVRPTPGGVENLLRAKIREHSFEEGGHPGNIIRTTVVRDDDGVWHALCIDDSRWRFHEEHSLWIEDKPEVAAA